MMKSTVMSRRKALLGGLGPGAGMAPGLQAAQADAANKAGNIAVHLEEYSE